MKKEGAKVKKGVFRQILESEEAKTREMKTKKSSKLLEDFFVKMMELDDYPILFATAKKFTSFFPSLEIMRM